MLTETETAFLAVIRTFLTEEKTAPEEIVGLTEKQWNHFFVLAAQHSLLAAAYDVVGKTPAFLSLPEEFRQQVKRQAMQSMMQQVSRTTLFLADAKALEDGGIRPLVMKGIVCRNLYPKPDLRPSGDEDLLILPENFAAVDAYFIQKGFLRDKEWAGPWTLQERKKRENKDRSKKEDDKKENRKEYNKENEKEEKNALENYETPEEMGYRHPKTGAFYEIHTALFPKDSAAYGYLNRAFTDIFSHAANLEIQGQTIWTLGATEHLFYLLCHSFKHFLHGGVGIRQICDMVQMIRAWGKKIDWERFWKLCEQYHMVCFCVNLLDIGERYLGFSYEACGAVRYFERDKKNDDNGKRAVIEPDSEALLEDILDAGAFGKTSEGRMHSANITLYAAETGAKKNDGGGIWRSLFPKASYIKEQYPFVKKHPYLLPVAYGKRIGRWCAGQRKEKKTKSSIVVGEERVALLKKYDMIRTAEKKR